MGQRWCRPCRTSAQRDRRAALRARPPAAAPIVARPSDTTPADLGTVRDVLPGALTADCSTAVLPAAVAAALAHLRHAESEYERARARDWRRSAVSPATVLQSLSDAVLRARTECRCLGVPEQGLRCAP